MTLQQLEYAVAVAQWGSFVTAADKCFVTQPTLSMQVKKLEEEAGITLFDRSRQPAALTDAGRIFIDQARVILREQKRLREIIASTKGEIAGELRIGIIPTVAPYLLPLFADRFTGKYPEVSLVIDELTTENLITALKEEQIDCGILATPLHETQLNEIPLYREPFVAYLSKKSSLWNKRTLKTEDIDPDEVWLLADGHCMRNQVLQLCGARKDKSAGLRLNYQSGSLETLRRLVDLGHGMTVLPLLAVAGLTARQQESLRYFRTPEPVREISIVTHRAQLKKALIAKLAETIQESLPKQLKRSIRQDVIGISV
ncbi:MAG TPA: LysR substrate-binding domain-containing protein [Bacteroidia bacterium]|nr:LysR substrate-binding domain-containing protein [Bacteroidia bacterium]